MHCNVCTVVIHLGSCGKHSFCIVGTAGSSHVIQNRKSIPTYKLNTLTYAFCFLQFAVQVQVVACIECLISEFMEGNIIVLEGVA